MLKIWQREAIFKVPLSIEENGIRKDYRDDFKFTHIRAPPHKAAKACLEGPGPLNNLLRTF